MRISSRMLGTIRACEQCPIDRTFNDMESAQAHADQTGHTLRPLLDISEFKDES